MSLDGLGSAAAAPAMIKPAKMATLYLDGLPTTPSLTRTPCACAFPNSLTPTEVYAERFQACRHG